MGGTEFVLRPENEALHDYVLEQVEAPEPRICLLPTAGGDTHHQITAFHTSMDRRRCRPTTVSLFRLGESGIDLESHLLAQDAIYVTGGNMVNLMAIWREHGIDRILAEAHRRGTLLCGYSAGSMCWFERGVSRGAGRPVATDGIGLLDGSHCVHYTQDPGRRRAYREMVASGTVPPGLALDDHAAALFRAGRLVEVVASRPDSGGYRVAAKGDGPAAETALPARRLSAEPRPRDPAVEEMRELRMRRRAGRDRTRTRRR